MRMNPLLLVGVLMISTILLSGCSEDITLISKRTTLQTVNGTSYDPSRSFELVKFCSSASFDENPDPNLLNCAIGNITDTFYSNLTGNWSCMSCSFDSSKCVTSSVSNISLYGGLNISSEHIISSDFDGFFSVMCCNSLGSMCYRPLPISNNGTYDSCDAGYNELVGSITFNNVSNNWSVTSCLNGFK